MNEDLHDIDKLFRDGIDGHLKEPPASVWEGVNHDLDKSQAIHYREKYNRLKRAALVASVVLVVALPAIFYYVTRQQAKQEDSREGASPARINTGVRSSQPGKKTETTTLVPGQEKSATQKNGASENPDSTGQQETVTIQPANKNGFSADAQQHINSLPVNEDHLINNPSVPDQPSIHKSSTQRSTGGQLKNDQSTSDKSAGKQPAFDKSSGNQSTVHHPATNQSVADKLTTEKATLRQPGTDRLTAQSSIEKSSKVASGNKDKKANDIVVNKMQPGTASPLPSNTVPVTKPVSQQEEVAQKNRLFALPVSVVHSYSLASLSLKPVPEAEHRDVVINQQPIGHRINASHEISLGAFAAPNISFDRFKDDDHLAGPGRNRNEVRRDENVSYSFSTGLTLGYMLNEKLSLQTGITFTTSTTSISPKTLYARTDNNGHTSFELHCSSGFSYIMPKGGAPPAPGDSIKTSGVRSRLNYVSVPVSLNLHVQKGKFSFEPSLGVGTNFLASGKTSTSLLGQSGAETAVSDISGLKPVYMDGRIGLGASYSLTRKLSVTIRPTARLALTSINKETPVRSYQNYLSVETGIRIKL